MGITQIILNGELELNFGDLIDTAYDKIASRYETKRTKEETKARVYAFMAQRLNNVLSDAGLAYDTANAVMHATPDNFCLIRKKGEALEAFRSNENFAPLMAGFTRVNNLAKNAESAAYDESLFTEKAEKDLAEAAKAFKAQAADALAKDDFDTAFNAIAALRAPIDAFLTDIMVMCDDEKLKASRLGLLKALAEEMLAVADFTAIADK